MTAYFDVWLWMCGLAPHPFAPGSTAILPDVMP
jgi:hypothetical protein